MNYLLAKTKGKRGRFFKVISNQQIFDFPEDLNNSIQYDPNYKLEEDEWFCISSFSEKEFCIDLLTKQFVAVEYDQITIANYVNINYLIAYQTKIYYFQKLSSNNVLKKSFFEISDAPSIVNNKRLIIINDLPDAIYDKNNDTLYFKRLNSLSTIFKGIEELYKEATQEETQVFLENNFIQLVNEYSADNVKTMNRKRIAIAKETLQQFSPQEKKNIFGYIREYCGDLNFNEDREQFLISSEEDLKKLLYGIEQRYYTTRIGGEKRLANSILTLE